MDTQALKNLILGLSVFAVAAGGARGQMNSDSTEERDKNVLRQLPHWTFTTESYKREALRRAIQEANQVAEVLRLQERLPITISNLTEVFIGPPALATFATISTSNYVYYAGVGKKFSGLGLRDPIHSFYAVKSAYTWPIRRLNTNNAFQIATQILVAAGMDVTALNQHLNVKITACKPEEMGGRYFVPIYWITWHKAGDVVAFIELAEPTKSVRQFSVFDSKYILRKPLSVPNLAQLLNQTNVSSKPNVPSKLP